MAVIDFNSKHLTPHRRNIITSFVDSARNIIKTEGIENVTIKKLGESTKLNPATIYNYFDNVEHLLYFAKLEVFDEFNEDLSNWVKEGDDPLMVYKKVWRAFAKHSFEKPEEYREVLFSPFAKSHPDYMYQYRKIFPVENTGFPAYLEKVLLGKDIEEKLNRLIEVAKYVGYFDENSARKTNDMCLYIYEGFLNKVADGKVDKYQAYDDFCEYLEITVNALKQK
ncbi:MAG: TetR/AcrR family transcriptional regulator [Ezakiella sp.]|nr:TetR/AcrR family transcriptional regulator [Ezakiella sp.]MDD7471366.1 TetR/AcrR family transcriptional regulator [Bacillota bacterium]MDY3923539.1 TetR/AcrR family transcriptional regulator [Ezakiella sp.]